MRQYKPMYEKLNSARNAAKTAVLFQNNTAGTIENMQSSQSYGEVIEFRRVSALALRLPTAQRMTRR